MKTISLLGSTGSIGTQTLDVIRRNKDIKVAALAAGTRVKELAAQAREFKPELVCIGSEKLAGDLKTELADMHWQKMVLFTSSVKLSTRLVKLPPIQPIKLSHWVKSVKMLFQV